MENQPQNFNQNDRNEELWKIAKKRVAFKWSLFTYAIVNAFLVMVWYWSIEEHDLYNFWPKWVMFGWGIGIAFQYLHAYHGNNIFNINEEYEKLKNNDRV